jgi:murein DD-endopeptidase MepM/ murein hydrolase activator NlpD
MQTLTSKQIAEVIHIGRPLLKTAVSQEFGKSKFSNLQKWYESFGWLGHNGIDYATVVGTKAYCVYPGVVTGAYFGEGGGNTLCYDTDLLKHKSGVGFKLRFYYLHLSKFERGLGDRVGLGDVLCRTGNTGKYTTGPHLHFHVVPYYKVDVRYIADRGNGYDGAVDPASLFVDYNLKQLPVDRCYEKKRNLILEYTFRFANTPIGVVLTPFLSERIKAAQYVHRTLKARGRSNPLLTDRESNALIYGSWDLETVLDSAMFPIWGWYTKDEVLIAKQSGEVLSTPLIGG